jgi:hypothetical protein
MSVSYNKMSAIKVAGTYVNTIPSGVSAIGNVSLDITGQTYLRDKLFVGNDASFNTIYSSVVPTTANMLCNKTYVDSVGGTSILGTNNTFTGTNNFQNISVNAQKIQMGSTLTTYTLTQNTGQAPIVSNAWIPTRLNVPINNPYSFIYVGIPFDLTIQKTAGTTTAGNMTIQYNSITFRILKNGSPISITTEQVSETDFTPGGTKVWGLPASITNGSFYSLYWGYFYAKLNITPFNTTADTYDIEITMNATATTTGGGTWELRAVGKGQGINAGGTTGVFTSTRAFTGLTPTTLPTYPTFVDAYYFPDTRIGIITNDNTLIRSKNDIEFSTGNNLYFKTYGDVDSNMNFNTGGLAEFSAGTNFNVLVGDTTSFSQHTMDMYSVGTNTIDGANTNISTNSTTLGITHTSATIQDDFLGLNSSGYYSMRLTGTTAPTGGLSILGVDNGLCEINASGGAGAILRMTATGDIQMEATDITISTIGTSGGALNLRANAETNLSSVSSDVFITGSQNVIIESTIATTSINAGTSIDIIASGGDIVIDSTTAINNRINGAVKQTITTSTITSNPSNTIDNQINGTSKLSISSTATTLDPNNSFNMMPTATIIQNVSASVPSGFLYCNGQAVNRTGTYARLFASIGTTFGVGNGTTTFNIPDFRGAFLRGASSQVVSGTTYTAGAVGTAQLDMALTTPLAGYSTPFVSTGFRSCGSGTRDCLARTSQGDPAENPTGLGFAYPTSRSGTEVRPMNYSVYYYIRY